MTRNKELALLILKCCLRLDFPFEGHNNIFIVVCMDEFLLYQMPIIEGGNIVVMANDFHCRIVLVR